MRFGLVKGKAKTLTRPLRGHPLPRGAGEGGKAKTPSVRFADTSPVGDGGGERNEKEAKNRALALPARKEKGGGERGRGEGELGWGVCSGVRIWHLGSGEGRGLWERELGRGFWGEGELVKRDGRGREVWCARVEGERVAVKARPLPRVLDRVRFRLGRTDLGRSCLGAALLRSRGVATPGVRVLGLVRCEGAWREVLVTAWAEGPTLLSAWADARASDRLGLARTGGELVGQLSRLGLFNRDAKPSNVVLGGADGRVMVDVGGVRLAGGDRAQELARMISALGFEPTGVGWRPGFGETVAGVRAALRSSGADRRVRGRVVAALRGLIASHGEMRPKDDPLAHGRGVR